MAKIVGIKDARELKSKKTGKEMHAWMVWVVFPGGRGVVGQEAEMQFVDAELFAAAVGSRKIEDLIGKECQLDYDRRGFLSSFSVG